MKKIVKLIISIVVLSLIIVVVALFIKNQTNNQHSFLIVSKMPNKLTYYVNESLDTTGLEIKKISKKESSIIPIEECVFDGFDSSVANDQVTIYITYQELQTSFNVRVIEKPVEEVSIKDIEMYQLPTKITYEIGDSFNSNGGVIKVNYTNEEYKLINLLSNYVYGFDSSKPNDNLVLTVKYKEKGKIYTTTFSVVIKE